MKFRSKEVSDILLKIFYSITDGNCELNTNIREYLDSLDAVEFAMEMEKKFDIEISDDDLYKMFDNKHVTLLNIKEELRIKYDLYSIKDDRKEKIEKIKTIL